MPSVVVWHKRRKGWHVFTSKDAPGLMVASTRYETALNDVGPSLELLMDRPFAYGKDFIVFTELTDDDRQWAEKEAKRLGLE